MSINVASLAKDIRDAVKGELGEQWPEIKDYASAESRKFAETIKMIGKLTAQGQMTPAEAKLHLRMQKNAAVTVLLTVEGLGLLAVENAINAAIKAIKGTVNTALGFTLF